MALDVPIYASFFPFFPGDAGMRPSDPEGLLIKWNFKPQSATPKGIKKRFSRCPQGQCVGYMMMPSPKGSVRYAQLFMTERGLRARPAAGQCPAPMLDTQHYVPGIQRAQSGNRARRGEL